MRGVLGPLLGAHVEANGVRFGVFTQAASCAVELVAADDSVIATLALEPRGEGYFQLLVEQACAGMLYWLVIDGKRLPDPYARYLPRGVHGPAEVVAPKYQPKHEAPARPLSEQVIYELHIGTFTDEGTFDAARGQLPALAELGVTTLELMPLAAFAGDHGWGYDGVALFAPHAAYGTPDQLRELVDTAHQLGLGVLLDVVYNHFGPSGNYLAAYFDGYFRDDLENAWGKAPNFRAQALRNLVLDNARYWLTEFAFDGLRLDATHAIFDDSPQHILSQITDLVHQLSPGRAKLVIAEDERNLAELVSAVGLDALWADDFHHQLRVTLVGDRSGYYAAFEPSARGVADAINRGWIYAGQRTPLTGEARGTAAENLPAEALVYCIQNHDQVGNRAFGDRLDRASGYDAFRAASLLLLFLPMTPLLFMGQEWAASTPFLYFTDHEPELGALVTEGRRREFSAFHQRAELASPEPIPDPQALATFRASKLRWSERTQPEHAATLELYRAALALRRSDPVLARAGRERLLAEARDEVLIVQRWYQNQRRVLSFNLGSRPLSPAQLASELGLHDATVLLQSSRGAGDVLTSGNAILLAGENESSAEKAP